MRNLLILFENVINKIKLGKKNFKEVNELIADLKQNRYGDIKLNIINKDNAVIKGVSDADHIELSINFPTREMVQKQLAKSTALLPSFMLPHRESTTIAKGTLDGNIKRVKTSDFMSNREGAFMKITKIENRVSGNTYRRTETQNEKTYEKLVNGNYVNLFHV